MADTTQFHDIFFEEAAERLQELETSLLRLESDAGAIDTLFRAVHSLKGASGTFGFESITAVTHVFENVLDGVRQKTIAVTPRLIDVSLSAADAVKALVEAAREGRDAPQIVDAITRALIELVDSPAVAHGTGAGIFAHDGAEIFDETPSTQAAKAVTKTDDHATDVSTLRVPAVKLDRLVDLVGELVIAQSILAEALRRANVGALDDVREAASHVERNMRELQERVMDVRMVPMGTVFTRFPRLVRDLAASSGKKITLEVSGEDTELDKILVEHLPDPLTHIIRNAIDHGIEAPEQRVANGKPDTGTVALSAFTRGGSVFIDVRDDGRGLSHEKVQKRALERGLISKDQHLSRTEIEALVFAPGFSTADKVSTISGRGVGMDVVKRTVESLGGAITLLNEPGVGMTARLRLPLTLAMMSGMSVSVGGETYVLPILSIVESLRPRRDQVKTLLGQSEVVLLRGETLPIIRMDRLFGQTSRAVDPWDAILVVVENEGKRIALLVDDLLGEQQVVVKSLDANFRRVDGVMGATVMGNGRVALIVDTANIIRGYTERDDEKAAKAIVSRMEA